MKSYLKLIDTNTQGRCDVTPLFADAKAFTALIEDLAEPFISKEIGWVAGIDALGFILGTAIALRLNKGFIAIRKAGKLPGQSAKESFVDYSGKEKSLEIRKGIIKSNSRILLVDEWIETGAQVSAAIKLIENEGGIVSGIATINADSGPVYQMLETDYFFHAIAHEMNF